MNSRTWIVLLAFLGWSIISWYYYTCKIKGFCGNAPVAEKQVEADAVPEKNAASIVDSGPLSFKWGGAEALTSDEWIGYSNGILSTGSDGQILVVSGPYFDDESTPEGFENMGMARASHISGLLSGKLEPEMIELTSHSISGKEDVDKSSFADTQFKWVTRNENIQETMDGALVYFPSNSDEKISNPNIESYLDRLAKSLIANGGTVEVVGHTDNTGSWQFNKNLGMERALSIKKTLVSKGVDAAKITASSHGEAKPIASNDNEEGKQKNRRTEIIIKK